MRNGTPRQGGLVPNSRATLQLASLSSNCKSNKFTGKAIANPTDALSKLCDFSHVWLIFLFHENTNSARQWKGSSIPLIFIATKIRTLSVAKEDDYMKINNNHWSLVKSKVRPPRLGGSKVGLFSTRTPHRPNPIGLTVAKLVGIDVKGIIYLNGIDLIDGTPILDIKPYVPQYDSIVNAMVPNWMIDPSPENSVPRTCVRWSSLADKSLRTIFEDEKLEFFSSNGRTSRWLTESNKQCFYENQVEKEYSALRAAIQETVQLDMRSIHQKVLEQNRYSFYFDNILIHFTYEEESILIEDINFTKRNQTELIAKEL